MFLLRAEYGNRTRLPGLVSPCTTDVLIPHDPTQNYPLIKRCQDGFVLYSIELEPIPGLEPGTHALRMRCSTNWAISAICVCKDITIFLNLQIITNKSQGEKPPQSLVTYGADLPISLQWDLCFHALKKYNWSMENISLILDIIYLEV